MQVDSAIQNLVAGEKYLILALVGIPTGTYRGELINVGHGVINFKSDDLNHPLLQYRIERIGETIFVSPIQSSV